MEVMNPILGRKSNVIPTQFSRGQWQIVRCVETDFVFLKDPPAYEALESQDLEWSNSFQQERKRRWNEEPLLSRISWASTRIKRRLFPKRNRFFQLACKHLSRSTQKRNLAILDVGCGGGTLLADFHHRFADLGQASQLCGIEVSQQLATSAQKLITPLGGTVVREPALDGIRTQLDSTIDLVIMSSFLEHESQPLKLLTNLKRCLTNNGIVLIKVPNFSSMNRLIRGRRWCGFRYPDHVSYFTPKTLNRLASEAGMQMHQSITDRPPFSDNMYAVLSRQGSL